MRYVQFFALIFSVMVVGCQSVSPKTSTEKTLTAKQQDYDKLLEEWQTLKPGIERLLVIEEELNLLLGELGRLQASLAEQQSDGREKASKQPVAYSAPVVSVPQTPQVVSPANTVAASHGGGARTGNYALQVASITEPHLLPTVWKQMTSKHPQLLANLEPNFQKIQVRNTDYYRLKVGSFETMADANRTCTQLKSAGVSCLVVDYSGSNFSQLVN